MSRWRCVHGLNTRRSVAQITMYEGQLERARDEVKNARKEVKRFLRRIERDWWSDKINECKEACERGKIGDMYKCLRKIGIKGVKANESGIISISDFKSHFESVLNFGP